MPMAMRRLRERVDFAGPQGRRRLRISDSHAACAPLRPDLEYDGYAVDVYALRLFFPLVRRGDGTVWSPATNRGVHGGGRIGHGLGSLSGVCLCVCVCSLF